MTAAAIAYAADVRARRFPGKEHLFGAGELRDFIEGRSMTALAQRSATDETPVVRTIAQLRAQIDEWRRQGETVGLVPTMGAPS